MTGAAARRRLAPVERGEKSLLRVPERSAPSVQLPGNTSLRRPARLLAAPHAGQQLRRYVRLTSLQECRNSCTKQNGCVAPLEQHFTEVVGSEEFLNLGMEQISSLIASDKLTIPTEEKVFEAVIAWVNHDKDVRQEHLAHLMEHVRLPLLTREYLVQVWTLQAKSRLGRLFDEWSNSRLLELMDEVFGDPLVFCSLLKETLRSL